MTFRLLRCFSFFPCVKCANANYTNRTYDKVPEKTQHVVYFWKADCSRISNMIFPCVKSANTKHRHRQNVTSYHFFDYFLSLTISSKISKMMLMHWCRCTDDNSLIMMHWWWYNDGIAPGMPFWPPRHPGIYLCVPPWI